MLKNRYSNSEMIEEDYILKKLFESIPKGITLYELGLVPKNHKLASFRVKSMLPTESLFDKKLNNI
jgi:hypothetical protein